MADYDSKDIEDGDVCLNLLTLRQYQTELIETSKKQNSIVFLPTGSGKTLIAIHVLRSRMKDLIEPSNELRKIAVFLATTKLLVNQINNVIQENTNLKTKLFSGEMGIDDWTVNTWQEEIGDAQVLVLVPAVFLIIIQRKVLSLEKVSLIVFDECHHAVSSHPYRRILLEFDYLPEYKRPLVLGLTGTVLNRNPEKEGFEEVKALKETFRAVFAKTDCLEESMRYGTCAKERFVSYDPDQKTNAAMLILNLLNKTYSRLNSQNIPGMVERQAKDVVPGSGVLLCKRNPMVKNVLNILKHIERALSDLGLYPVLKVALYYYMRLERLKLMTESSAERVVIKYAHTILNIIRRIVCRYVPMDDKDRIRKYSSQKLNSLLKLVEQYKNNEHLRCLIIVEEKVTAVVLSAIFNELQQNEDKFYKANFITGGLFSSVFDTEETKYEQKRLKAIIKSFRQNEFHFLFATDVAEEGTDIQSCNLVVKFDVPTNYRSYIQSKGRARFKNSDYVIFTMKEEKAKLERKIDGYNKTQEMLLKALLKVEGILPMMDEKMIKEDDEEYFYVKGPDGPHITGAFAISLVTRYCSLLPKDKYSFLVPICWYDAITKRAFVKLPSSSPIRKIIEGEPRQNRKLAKKNAFLKTVVKLYEIGEILDDFTFRSHECKEEELKEVFTNLVKLSPKNRQGFESNMKKKYEIQFAQNLSQCLPQTGSESYIHVIQVKPQFSRPEDSRTGTFYDMLCDPNGFAILSSKRLNKICEFPLFLSMGEFSCSLVVNSATVKLNECDIQKLKKFHFFIFNTLLQVVNRLQVIDDSDGNHSFFIVPINYIQEKVVINWDAINDFVSMSETGVLTEILVQNPTIKDYLHRVVYPKYHQSSYTNRYYVVTAIDDSQTPMSMFPSEDYGNYFEYFISKYEVTIMNKEQPLIEVKCLPERINYLKPRKPSSSKSNRKNKEYNEQYKEHLVPELCELISFPAILWLKATLLPSVLHRITTITHIDEVRQRIASETKIGNCDLGCNSSWLPLEAENYIINEEEKSPHFEWTQNAKPLAISKEENFELQSSLDLFRHMDECAPCDMIHYVKCFGLISDENNSVKSHQQSEKECENISVPDLSAIEVPDLPIFLENRNTQNGPELRDLIKTFTCRSANDIVDLEKYEFLGDSFLKFSTVLYAFKNYNTNEGKLVSIKDRIVCNKNLYACGKEKGLEGVLLTNEFDARSGWNAPLFGIPQELKNLVKENNFKIEYFFEIPVKDKLSGKLSPKTLKTIQDFNAMEEMRSIYTPDEAVLGLKTVKDKSIADCVEALLGLYVMECGLEGGFKMLNWFNILPEATGSIAELMGKKYVTEEGDSNQILETLTGYCYEELENILGYRFQDKSLLVEALTHPSVIYLNNPSYQRLEFLGDAVIDFIVSLYIHHICPKLSPGDMTDIRMSLVNNVTMACIAVKYNLHKYLIYQNSSLMGAISQFVNLQKDRNHKIEDTTFIFHEEEEQHFAESIEVPKAIGDLFESLAGAMFLDSGNCLKTVWKTYYRLMKDAIEVFMKNPMISPLRKLYELCHPPPQFTFETSPSGFVVASCKIIHNDKEKSFMGRASSMQNSKLSAARMAVRFLEGFADKE